jgi:hypothetical protein
MYSRKRGGSRGGLVLSFCINRINATFMYYISHVMLDRTLGVSILQHSRTERITVSTQIASVKSHYYNQHYNCVHIYEKNAKHEVLALRYTSNCSLKLRKKRRLDDSKRLCALLLRWDRPRPTGTHCSCSDRNLVPLQKFALLSTKPTCLDVMNKSIHSNGYTFCTGVSDGIVALESELVEYQCSCQRDQQNL